MLGAALTLERLEEVIRIDLGQAMIGMMLKEFVTGLGVAQAAQGPELGEVQIGKLAQGGLGLSSTSQGLAEEIFVRDDHSLTIHKFQPSSEIVADRNNASRGGLGLPGPEFDHAALQVYRLPIETG